MARPRPSTIDRASTPGIRAHSGRSSTRRRPSTSDTGRRTRTRQSTPLLELAEAPVGGRILEIGPGPGTLTLPLASRGFDVTAVEPGPRMAAMLRRPAGAVAPYGGRRVNPGGGTEPAARLRPRRRGDGVPLGRSPNVGISLWRTRSGSVGALALIRSDHVLTPQSEAYYRGVQPFYEREFPDDAPYIPPTEAELGGYTDEMVRKWAVRDRRRTSLRLGPPLHDRLPAGLDPDLLAPPEPAGSATGPTLQGDRHVHRAGARRLVRGPVDHDRLRRASQAG